MFFKIADFVRRFDGVSIRDTNGDWFLSKENIFDKIAFFFTRKAKEVNTESIVLPAIDWPEDCDVMI